MLAKPVGQMTTILFPLLTFASPSLALLNTILFHFGKGEGSIIKGKLSKPTPPNGPNATFLHGVSAFENKVHSERITNYIMIHNSPDPRRRLPC